MEKQLEQEINIFDVANYIIDKIPDITHMKLQKLIYYAHAFYLVEFKNKLINSILQAWVYGPVFPELYMEFRQYSNKPVQKTDKGNEDKISEERKISIDKVIKKYGHMSSGELSVQTHNESPWFFKIDKSDDWSKNVIEDKDLESYFMSGLGTEI
ncbi:Panacea domain-containing protein ['Camptotheca acuminata' phytoplasma]|uniref:Panacea domain-containing protein n=1 Tax='Camptotheca acuminata' phytoplasma TaxID=3239192 RepID=UPI00351AA894